MIRNKSLNLYPSVEENISLLSKKWKIAPEIYDLHLGKREDVVDTIVNVNKVIFHIPKLSKDNQYVLWKCLWPDCHNCCERQDRLPLTRDDFKVLSKKLDYDSEIDFLKNETLISSWKHGEFFDVVNSMRTQVVLKREIDETEEQDGTLIPCRFLNDKGCSIHPDKPGVCWMYPFASYVQFKNYDNIAGKPASISIHATFQFTGDCPGFYLDNSIDSMMPILEEYSQRIYDYNMSSSRTKREGFCVVSSVNVNTTGSS
jgi:Fe-S-cluster containining protein